MSDASPTPETAPAPEAVPPDMAAILAAQEAERAQAEADAQAEREQAEAEAAAFAADLAARTIPKANGFGPTFPAELLAAGFDLGALPFTTPTAEVVLVAPGVTRAVRARIEAAVGAHDPHAPPPVNLADYAKAAHTALRDGGVTVGGMRIKTDSESRGLIDGAYALSQAQPDSPIDFKASSGWITIDAATMQTVAVAVGRWVQACYTAYRAVDGKIGAGTITAPAQVDAAFAAVTLPG